MKLGIFTKTFPGSDPLTVFNAQRRAGYALAHYNMACSGLAALPSEIPDATVAIVHAASAAAGVNVCGLSATFNMIHPDAAVRQAGLASLDALAGAAAKLSIPILTLCTGTRDANDPWQYHVGNQSKDAWRDLCATMARAVDIAETHGVFLGVEPEHANVVNSVDAGLRLLREMNSTRIKFVIDPANLIEGVAPSEQARVVAGAVAAAAPHIAMAHAKDRDHTGRVVAAGQGIVDFPHFFRLLKQVEFSGTMVTHGLKDSEAVVACRYLTDTGREAGWDIE